MPIREGQIVTGPLFSEPMRVETVRLDGPDAWTAGLVGLRSEQFRRATLPSLTNSRYPRRSEEKRLLDAMLLAVPR